MQQAHELIHGQRQQAKHPVAHHLGVTLNPDVVAAELILESCIHPFCHGALVVVHRFGRIEFNFLAAARVVINRREVSQVFAMRLCT